MSRPVCQENVSSVSMQRIHGEVARRTGLKQASSWLRANAAAAPRGVIGRFASVPFQDLRASALPCLTRMTGTASAAPSCSRSMNKARISLSVEWVSFLRALSGVSQSTSSISPTSARCTGPSAAVRLSLSTGEMAVAIQKRMCFVFTSGA